MIRGPRPWEDNSEYNKKAEELKEKNKDKKPLISLVKQKPDYGL